MNLASASLAFSPPLNTSTCKSTAAGQAGAFLHHSLEEAEYVKVLDIIKHSETALQHQRKFAYGKSSQFTTTQYIHLHHASSCIQYLTNLLRWWNQPACGLIKHQESALCHRKLSQHQQ